jgi:catechol 2,3-dioxygenase-like lactoylglutathione lyase family enzyme
MSVMSHVEIGVRDLTRSQEFYGGLLGFTPVAAQSGGGTLVMQAGAARVKLVETGPNGTPSGWIADDLQCGFRHFGLKVDEVDSRIARLAEAGVEVRVPPLDAFGGVRLAFFADPDGAHLEFVSGPLQYQPLWSRELAAEEEASLHGDWDGAPRFDHVAVTVSDLDRALAYYRDTLGIPVVGQLDQRHCDERGFLITYFRAGSTVIEIFSFDVDTTPSPWQPEPDLLGIRAIGIDVVDAEATRHALLEAGGYGVAWRNGRAADLIADQDQVVTDLAP